MTTGQLQALEPSELSRTGDSLFALFSSRPQLVRDLPDLVERPLHQEQRLVLVVKLVSHTHLHLHTYNWNIQQGVKSLGHIIVCGRCARNKSDHFTGHENGDF
jgi:hypothetical protein